MIIKLTTALDKWERSILNALVKGHGKHKDFMVIDLFDYMKLIYLLRQGKSVKAGNYFSYHMNTYSKDNVPSIIRHALCDLYEDNSYE
jgi:hypothetical protein